MVEQIDKKQEIKDGLKDAIPIMAGYLTAAMAFGLLAKNLNIPIILVFLFSLLNFAGSSQFMAMNFMAIGAGIGEMILTLTKIIMARHNKNIRRYRDINY